MNDPMNNPDPDHLTALARRVAGDPYFLASAIAGYQDRHNLDDAALAAELGCAPAALVHIALCRMPGAAAPGRTVESDVAEIAARFGLATAALRRVVEEAAGGGVGAADATGKV